MDTPPPVKRWLPVAVGFAVVSTAAVVMYASSRSDEDLWQTIRGLTWWALPAALSMHIGAHMMWGARVAVIGRATGVRMTPISGWALITAGTFGGAVTPGRVGGEAVKLGILARGGIRPAHGSRILLVDRALDMVFFIVLGGVAVILLPPLFGADAQAARVFAGLGVAFLLGFVSLIVILLASPRLTAGILGPIVHIAARLGRRRPDSVPVRIIAFVQDVRVGIIQIARRRPGAIGVGLLLTTINWIVEYMALWTLLTAFGHALPYWVVFVTGGVLTLVSNIPVTPGGTGVAEAAGLALLLPLAPGLSPLIVVAWRGVTYYYDLLVGSLVSASMVSPRARNRYVEAA